VFVGLWHQACGIEPPVNEEKRKPKTAYASIPAAEPVGKPAEQPVTPGGFTSQARVMRWFNHQEPVRPPWRSSLPPAEADDGSWVGD
jgi:hypothetical protein